MVQSQAGAVLTIGWDELHVSSFERSLDFQSKRANRDFTAAQTWSPAIVVDSLMMPEQFGAAARPRPACRAFLGYFDGHTSSERPGTSEKSSWLKVTKVARCTRA